jgi:hypothetical protein
MNNYLIVFFCVLTMGQLGAQEIFNNEIKWGESTKNNMLEMAPEFVGVLSGKVITISTKSSKSIIEEYDPITLANKGKHELDLKYEKSILKREKELIFQNNLILITSYVNKTQAKKYFFIQSYLGDGKLTKPSLVGSMIWENVPGIIASKEGNVKREMANSTMKLMVSPDESHLAILLAENAIMEEISENNWNAYLYEDNLKQKWSYKFGIPNKAIYLDKVNLSNDGRIYCSGIENVNLEKRIFIANYYRFNTGDFIGDEYYLLIVDGENETSNLIDLEMSDGDIVSYSMNLLNDEILFYGLTRNDEEMYDLTGVMIRKIDKNGKTLFSNFEDFSSDLLTYNEDTDPKSSTGIFSNKSNKIMRNFVLKDIIINENGDLMFIAEQFYFYITSTYSQTSGLTETFHYVYGDMIVVNCSEEGDLKWMKRIVKYQHTTNDFGYYSSFYSIGKGDNFYILMNDTEYYANYDELKDSKGSEKRSAKNNPVVSVVQISNEGVVDRDVLIDQIEKPYYKMAPSSAVLVDSKLIFVGKEFKAMAIKTSQSIGQIELK